MDKRDLVERELLYDIILLRSVGKSWTMTGCPCHSEHGLISNAIEHVFQLVHHQHSMAEQNENIIIKCAYFESIISLVMSKHESLF